jgi:hypothetical protein
VRIRGHDLIAAGLEPGLVFGVAIRQSRGRRPRRRSRGRRDRRRRPAAFKRRRPPRASVFVVALVVLLITFGAVVAAGMPLLTAGIGVGIGLAGIVALSAATNLSSAVISLAAMLGLAVGIDYALFIISPATARSLGAAEASRRPPPGPWAPPARRSSSPAPPW